MFELSAIQSALREFNIPAWLLFDFRGSNILARRVLDLDQKPVTSRRWAYLVPAEGEPRRLVHKIEPGALDHLPGEKTVYLTWQEFQAGIMSLAKGLKRVALEYAPRGSNPYVSRVDAGTVELVQAAGAEVISSGNLVQRFEATWDDFQIDSHFRAAEHTNSAYARAWEFIARTVRAKGQVHELEVQAEILRHFDEHKLTTYSPPMVGVGPHSGDPHYDTRAGEAGIIRENDWVLIDLWGKMNEPRAVYSDLTRVGFVGSKTPEKYEQVFQIVTRARDAAIAKVRSAYESDKPLCGWEVDDAARAVIVEAGYGVQFCHRTGHNIGQEVHGNGANMDNLETHEERLVLPRTCFSIEPGIYLPEFGARSEVNVFIDPEGNVHVTGGELQRAVVTVF